MDYRLFIGDYAYSSWSLRAWLLFDRFGIPATVTRVDFTRDVAAQLSEHRPARTVPTLITPEGAVVSESLAIAEELASRHPEAMLWPAEPLARATARTLASEMHSGFQALRSECPMATRVAYRGFEVSEAVRADLARIEEIWARARSRTQPDGPWLCGEYSAADAFFAPVAARIATYALPMSAEATAYVDAHLCDPSFRRFRAMGLVAGAELPWYARDYPLRPWPGPSPRAARIADGPSENDACPYSGKPVTDFLEMDGRIWGFCNTFCRDKTMADPEAWPAFMQLVHDS